MFTVFLGVFLSYFTWDDEGLRGELNGILDWINKKLRVFSFGIQYTLCPLQSEFECLIFWNDVLNFFFTTTSMLVQFIFINC